MSFLHAVRHLWNLKLNLAILFGFCHACSGMPKVLRNNKLTISPERNEWFSWLFAFSQASVEATNWLYYFLGCGQGCLGMRKVLWNNKLSMSECCHTCLEMPKVYQNNKLLISGKSWAISLMFLHVLRHWWNLQIEYVIFKIVMLRDLLGDLPTIAAPGHTVLILETDICSSAYMSIHPP